MADKVGAFALPGAAAGTTAPAFLGGSNLAISAKSEHQDLALDLLKIMTAKGYQTQFAQAGTVARAEVAARTGQRRRGGEGAGHRGLEQPVRPLQRRTGPASKASTVLPDMLVSIAQGGDLQAAAAQADQAITSQLDGSSRADGEGGFVHGDRFGGSPWSSCPGRLRPHPRPPPDPPRTRWTGVARPFDGAGDVRTPSPTH